MDFEDFQKAWQAQDAGAQVTIDAQVLLREVRRNAEQFRATIFWRDVREVGVAFLLAIFFMGDGLRLKDWTNGLVGLGCFGVGAFMVLDRMRQSRKQPVANDSLKTCAESSLSQVNHQIWLLKNVLWWYLLPIGAPLAVSTGISLWQSRQVTSQLLGLSAYGLGCILLYWGIYWINQYAVRKNLEPRRQELETLLGSLKSNNETQP